MLNKRGGSGYGGNRHEVVGGNLRGNYIDMVGLLCLSRSSGVSS